MLAADRDVDAHDVDACDVDARSDLRFLSGKNRLNVNAAEFVEN